jgi:hypothetical protein
MSPTVDTHFPPGLFFPTFTCLRFVCRILLLADIGMLLHSMV